MPALLALAAAAVFGAADFTGGYATRRAPVLSVTLITNLVGVVMAIVLVAIVGGDTSGATIGWSIAGGACGLGGLVLLYLGLARGPNRLVSPLSAVLAAVVPVAVGIGSGDRPGIFGVVGLALAAPAIWLVAGGDHRLEGSRATLSLAAGAGIGFGLFFTFLAQTPDDAGAVPLLVARLTSSAILLAAFARRRPTFAPENRAPWLAATAGVLDMSANGLFLWSARDGDLAVVGALTNLFPVTTILLAVTVLGERLTRTQAVGLGLAVTTAALLA